MQANPSGPIVLAVLSLVSAGACSREGAPKEAVVDEKSGAVRGTLQPPVAGAVVILCRAAETSCAPDPSLADTVDGRGRFAVSRVPPGHYLVAYALPDALKEGRPNVKAGDTLDFTFGKQLKIDATIHDGKWRLDQDASSETHVIAAGAEMGFGASGLSIANCGVQHKATGLWMEFREGHRYESVEVAPNKVSDLTLTRWGK